MSNCPIVVHEEVNEIVFGLIEKIWIYVSNKWFLLVEISGVTSSLVRQCGHILTPGWQLISPV